MFFVYAERKKFCAEKKFFSIKKKTPIYVPKVTEYFKYTSSLVKNHLLIFSVEVSIFLISCV